ncbi:hypothetical protein ACS0TY_033796 [Phlomoides rotata]
MLIQSSTIASESAFSTSGRILDHWLRVTSKPIEVEELIADLSNIEIDLKNDPQVDEDVFSRSSLDC